MTKTMLMAAAAVMMFAGAANAADDWRSGLYVKGAGGWNYSEDQEYNSGASNVDLEMDDGYALSGAVGMDYGDWRSELELAYRKNDVDSAEVNGVTAGGVSGEVDSTALMLNGYYDIPTGMPITPYVGAGVGVAHVNADGYTAGGTSAGGDDTVFAYQAMAGAEYALDTKMSLFTEYKYFGTEDIDVGASELDYDNHSIMAGIKYNFN